MSRLLVALFLIVSSLGCDSDQSNTPLRGPREGPHNGPYRFAAYEAQEPETACNELYATCQKLELRCSALETRVEELECKLKK